MASSGGWPFKDGEVPVTGRLRLNSLEGIRRAVLEEVGIGYLPSWMVAEQLRSGQLQAVLADHAGPSAPINAVYPTQTMVPRRATVFIDFIAALFAATPGLNGVAIV